MAGHSKWNNIKRKKEAADGKRGKIFTKMGREIAVAVREGGPDPASNSRLRDAIAKAKANNLPNDNIDRAIKKAAGDGDRNQYEEIVYEGYGPGGVAVMVEALTDNRNRTAGDLRHYFDKYGGNLGQSGSVNYMFTRKGVLLMDSEGVSEEKIFEDALLDGVQDIDYSEEGIAVYTDTGAFSGVRDALDKLGYRFESAQLEYEPSTYTELTDPDQRQKMVKMLELFEDNDDVQGVWHNWENEDE